MVRLHIKKGDEDLFLLDVSTEISISEITKEVVRIHNGRLKINRMSAEMENLANHGIHLPPNMVGLLENQISELKLRDEFAEKHSPFGGFQFHKDQFFRRNGQAPKEKMAEILRRTLNEAKSAVHKNQIFAGISLDSNFVKNEFLKLKNAILIVYPMGLPLHDPLHTEMTDFFVFDLDSGFGGFRDVMEEDKTTLWWAGKELKPEKILKNFVGKNEKTKITVKIAEKGKGAPCREPIFTEEQKKTMMTHAFRRQQELEKLENDEDDNYLNSKWADNSALKKSFQGMTHIQIGPTPPP